MTFIVLAAAVVFLIFAASLMVGAPFLPTRRRQINQLVGLIESTGNKTALFTDLGCGNGAVVQAVAKKGIPARGYEINPLLVLVAKAKLLRYKHASVYWANMWNVDLREADVIYFFGTQRFLEKLYQKLDSGEEGHVLISYGFRLNEQEPSSIEEPFFVYNISGR